MARIVTVTVPPGGVHDRENDLIALGPLGGAVTVTLEAPPIVWSFRSLSRSVPENVYGPAVPAVTLYVKEFSFRSMNLTVCPISRTWLASRLLET